MPTDAEVHMIGKEESFFEVRQDNFIDSNPRVLF